MILVHWEVLPRERSPFQRGRIVIRTACGMKIPLADAGRPGMLSTVLEGVTTCKACLRSLSDEEWHRQNVEDVTGKPGEPDFLILPGPTGPPPPHRPTGRGRETSRRGR